MDLSWIIPQKREIAEMTCRNRIFVTENGENIKKNRNMYREICLSNRMIGHKFRMMTNTISV